MDPENLETLLFYQESDQPANFLGDLVLNEFQVILPEHLQATVGQLFQIVKTFSSGRRAFRLPLSPNLPNQSEYLIQLPFEQGVFDPTGLSVGGCLTASKKTEIRLLAEGIHAYSSTLRLISFQEELHGYYATLEPEELFSIPFEESSILYDMPKVYANSKKGPSGGKNRRLPSSFASSTAPGGRKFKKVFAFVLQVVREDGFYHLFSLPFVVQALRPLANPSRESESPPSFQMVISSRSASRSSSGSASFSSASVPSLTLDNVIDYLLSDTGWAFKVRALAAVLETTEENTQIVELLQKMSVSLGRLQAHNYASSALDLLPPGRDLALPLDLIESWLDEQSQSVSEQGEDEAQQPTHATEEAEPTRTERAGSTENPPNSPIPPSPPTRPTQLASPKQAKREPPKDLRMARPASTFAPPRFRPLDAFSASGELPDDSRPPVLFAAFSLGVLVLSLAKLSLGVASSS